MTWLLETLVWMILTAIVASLVWGPTLPVIAGSLAVSAAVSVIGSILFFNKRT